MAIFRSPSDYFSYAFNQAQDPNDYLRKMSKSFRRPVWDLPAAASEAVIRGDTPMLSMPAAATENMIRGVDGPVQGQGSMFYNTLLRGG